MTEREKRLATAMIDSVKNGLWLRGYVVVILEDESKYGWVSEEAKNYIYENIGED